MPPPARKSKDLKAGEKLASDERKLVIDSEAFESTVNTIGSLNQVIIFCLLVWSFCAGSKNIDFIWSYLGTLQILSHLALLKIQIPMNALLMSKSLVSVSVLDIKEIQTALMKNSFFDVSQYYGTLIKITQPPKGTEALIPNVEAEIS